MIRRGVSLAVLVVLLLGCVALTALAGWRWAQRQATKAADTTAATELRANAGLLNSELQKFRLLPLVIAEFPDVVAVLAARDAGARARLDRQFEDLAKRTDAAVIYLIDSDGMTRAASNWRLPTSFVGRNYGFRPYFQDAMRRGSSELFALGTVSGRPGLYLARRVSSGRRALGAIIVKVEFDDLEAAWARSGVTMLVTDPNGVILITSRPEWRFAATAPLPRRVLEDALRTRQFGNAAPRRAPLELRARSASMRIDGKSTRFRIATGRSPTQGDRLVALAPLGPALEEARREALLWVLAAAFLIGVAGTLAFRQREKQRLLLRSRKELEEEVSRQTFALRDANERLIVESHEREEATANYVAAREELARANRLGTLGQITAGVAHEINQPIAAIRTFAENAGALLDRNRTAAARENLGRIVGLTDRVATITAELRAFARRKTPTPVQAELGSIIDGSMMLIGSPGKAQIRVDAPACARGRILIGDRVRVEQILINLFTNALDAVGRERHSVVLAARQVGDWMEIRVSDRGPGIDPKVRDTLFTPFETAKSGGLGLGLAIARDIAREFGGDLVLEPSAVASGASFLLTLRITDA